MKEFLKGNYKLDAVIQESEEEAEAGSTEAFERKALSRLGGSICFVSKKSFLWEGDKPKGEAQPAGGAAAAGEATTETASRADTEDGTAKARERQGEAQPAGGAAAAGEATTETASRADTEDGTAKAR